MPQHQPRHPSSRKLQQSSSSRLEAKGLVLRYAYYLFIYILFHLAINKEGTKHKQDYLLPRALTQRLAKHVLPPNTTIQKDALLAIQKAATVFISYLSSQYVFRVLFCKTEESTKTPGDKAELTIINDFQRQ
jgi:hypothetical protein